MTKQEALENLHQALRNARLADLDFQHAVQEYIKVTTENTAETVEPMSDGLLKDVIVDSVTHKDD